MKVKWVALAVIALGGAVSFVDPVRLAGLYLLRRAGPCPWRETMRSADNLRWQIEIKDRILEASKLVEKDPAGFNLWRTPKGSFWVPDGSDYSLPFNLAEQERKIYGDSRLGVRPGDVVLDCGAAVGVFTREALSAGARLVVAIELAPENLECLRRNLAEEVEAGRVIIYPKGVWDKDDVMTLWVDPGNSPADSVVMRPEKARPGPQVPLTTIDKLVEELRLERVDFIKMDVEGAEQKALAGAQRTLARFRPRLALSAYHREDDPVRIPQLVRQGWPGYRMECGVCADAKSFVRPDVLFFY